MDQAFEQIVSTPSRSAGAPVELNTALNVVRSEQDTFGWQAAVAACRRHPVCRLIHEDPLTRRSFTRPRGYAGDAELLDIIYTRDWRGLTPPPSQVGQAVFEHTIDCRAPAAVRTRRNLLAGMIDAACERTRAPHILSVACGHRRELALSPAFCAGQVGRFVGLDQDELSLTAIARTLSHAPVETVPGSIKLLFGGGLAREKFDFIYTAGLYDYLEEDFAQRLTRRMFDMLRPGGRLLVANFQPGVEDVGYMEAFMDWRLIYRDAAAMGRLSESIVPANIGAKKIFGDATESIVFLELDRVS